MIVVAKADHRSKGESQENKAHHLEGATPSETLIQNNRINHSFVFMQIIIKCVEGKERFRF